MNRHIVRVWAEVVEKGIRWGEDIVRHYADGGSPRSRAVSGDRGSENDPLLQARGKIGEAAVAIWLGRDPFGAVKWDMMNPDKGADMLVPCGHLIDIKTTFPRYKLIWSRNVNDLYYSKQFTALLAVSIDPDDYSICWIEGWVPKDEFFARKRIADGMKGLEKDTWWMAKEDLHDPDDLRKLLVPVTAWLCEQARKACETKKQFEFITRIH